MANPNPTIVFTVDLSALNPNSHLSPDLYTDNVNTGRTLRDARRPYKSTFIPGLFPGKNYELIHGETFTEYGSQAVYLKKTYAQNDTPILKVVSES